MSIQVMLGNTMKIDSDDLKKVTDEALMISMIKLLVFQELMDKSRINNNNTLKEKINVKPNEFFKSEEIDLKSQDNFNSFIKRLADEILEEIKKDDKTHFCYLE